MTRKYAEFITTVGEFNDYASAFGARVIEARADKRNIWRVAYVMKGGFLGFGQKREILGWLKNEYGYKAGYFRTEPHHDLRADPQELEMINAVMALD